MRFKLSDGYTGVTTMTRKKFESILLDGISIVAWEEEDALVSNSEVCDSKLSLPGVK